MNPIAQTIYGFAAAAGMLAAEQFNAPSPGRAVVKALGGIGDSERGGLLGLAENTANDIGAKQHPVARFVDGAVYGGSAMYLAYRLLR